MEGGQTELPCFFRIETLLPCGVLQRFKQVEHIGRAAAADTGDAVQAVFTIQPQSLPAGAHDTVGQFPVGSGCAAVGKQAGHTLPHLRRRVRHNAYNAARTAQPAAQSRAWQPGGNRQHQRAARLYLLQRRLHILRLHRQHQYVVLIQRRQFCSSDNAVLLRKRGQLVGTVVDGTDIEPAGAAHAGDNGRGHIACAEKIDGHDVSLYGGFKVSGSLIYLPTGYLKTYLHLFR